MARGNIDRLIAELREELDRAERGLREDEAGNPGESASNGPIAERKFREALAALTDGEADYAGAGMSVTEASQREMESLQRSRAAGPNRRELNSEDIENGVLRFNTQGQPRGYDHDRMDAMYKKLTAENQEMRSLMTRMRRQPTVAERNELSAARHRADGVYSALGRETPSHLPGESPLAYRARCADGLKDLSPGLRRANLDGLAAGPFGVVEDTIYADALASVKNGTAIPPMELRPHIYQDHGREITEYHGDPLGWMAPFMSGGARGRINKPEGVKL